jgi:hypothetical protein
VAQFIGLIAALPVLLLLLLALMTPLMSYTAGVYTIRAHRLVLKEVERRQQRDPLGDRISEAGQRRLKELEDARDQAEKGASDTARLDAAVAMLRGVSPSDKTFLTDLRARRSFLQQRSVHNILARCQEARSAEELAIRGSWWITRESISLRLAAILEQGLPSGRNALRVAGARVTDWTVAGLILGTVVWQVRVMVSHDGRFFDDLGGGVALGSFVGLAATAVALARRVLGALLGGTEARFRRSLFAALLFLLFLGAIVGPLRWFGLLDALISWEMRVATYTFSKTPRVVPQVVGLVFFGAIFIVGTLSQWHVWRNRSRYPDWDRVRALGFFFWGSSIVIVFVALSLIALIHRLPRERIIPPVALVFLLFMIVGYLLIGVSLWLKRKRDERKSVEPASTSAMEQHYKHVIDEHEAVDPQPHEPHEHEPQGMRSVFLPDAIAVHTEPAGQWELGRTALVLGGWVALSAVLAALFFRWKSRGATADQIRVSSTRAAGSARADSGWCRRRAV